jgi:hypothetical protein
MARELGMNPRKLGKLDNHKQEPWKAPLPQFIEHIYEKRFGRTRPERIVPVEEYARQERPSVTRGRRRHGLGLIPGWWRGWREATVGRWVST